MLITGGKHDNTEQWQSCWANCNRKCVFLATKQPSFWQFQTLEQNMCYTNLGIHVPVSKMILAGIQTCACSAYMGLISAYIAHRPQRSKSPRSSDDVAICQHDFSLILSALWLFSVWHPSKRALGTAEQWNNIQGLEKHAWMKCVCLSFEN